ncbi:DUF2563 family protein [Mycolicibacterium baixiangningiae]
MGAGFSRSAGEIVRRGAGRFAATQMTNGIFGDFDTANEFEAALRRADEAQTTTMQEHHARLSDLSEKASAGAAAFLAQDETSASHVSSVRRELACGWPSGSIFGRRSAHWVRRRRSLCQLPSKAWRFSR